ncbi:hypothetical protein FHS95_002920 [Sphingomonas naasensis]|uniref:Lipoprotein n=1 Tax=Sphingomonas naasensis TaxID=1344951 RepID=A0A4V3QVG8_9SPHN|nr:hypothetical protein [Sphingomonas naasensis]NIJ21217.1 hypothetical protein [Sphingomonas naasensis]TGX38662.1 hypothetical protein E5A74_17640 [Sphingomonas naasensis]
MRHLVLTIAFLAGACGDGVSTETTRDPTGQNVAAAAAEGKPAAITAAADCSNKPDFVPVYDDARVTTCVSSADGQPRHVSGSIVYWVREAPAKVLGWSREQANASGLGQRLSTPTSYSAGEQSKRSLMIVVEPMNGGTRATVNWGSGV